MGSSREGKNSFKSLYNKSSSPSLLPSLIQMDNAARLSVAFASKHEGIVFWRGANFTKKNCLVFCRRCILCRNYACVIMLVALG